MKKSPEEIQIFTYMAPHPLDEDSGTEPEFLEWIPGFINEDDEEEGTTALYRDSNIEIYKKIESLTEQYFKESVNNMWPLLSEIYIHSMQVAIDISGMLGSTNTSLAGYLFKRSNQQKGKYVFQLDLNLLSTYLKKEQNQIPLDFNEKSTWDHELIHLLDHYSITAAHLYKFSTSPHENFKYCLIKYREEGIADLYYVLHGHTEIKNAEEAIGLFKEDVIIRKKEIDFSVPSNDNTRSQLYQGINFYKYGPWLILEILREIEMNWDDDIVAKCIETISRNEPVPLETILEVIKRSLKIGPEDFLHSIEKYFEKNFIPLI
jgi:hypothetical protein